MFLKKYNMSLKSVLWCLEIKSNIISLKKVYYDAFKKSVILCLSQKGVILFLAKEVYIILCL
jgi:hypothetical protein